MRLDYPMTFCTMRCLPPGGVTSRKAETYPLPPPMGVNEETDNRPYPRIVDAAAPGAFFERTVAPAGRDRAPPDRNVIRVGQDSDRRAACHKGFQGARALFAAHPHEHRAAQAPLHAGALSKRGISLQEKG